MERPELVTEAHLVFLDELRESGETNMFGAAEYIVDEFIISSEEAKTILKYWMKSFGARHGN